MKKAERELNTLVAKMTDSYVECRDTGHQWAIFVSTTVRKPLFGKRRSMRCLRCSTERHELIDARGEVGARSYKYPDGYQLKGYGEFTRSRSRFRREWFTRS